MDFTETDDFADAILDGFPETANEVGSCGGLVYSRRKVSPGPMARREYARANRLEAEVSRLRAELAKRPANSGGLTIEAFAKLCGKSVRTIKYWNSNTIKKTPTVFDGVIKKYVTYSPALLHDSVAATRWATAYKMQKQVRRMQRHKASFAEASAVKSSWAV